jgi:CBS domain-containing protein
MSQKVRDVMSADVIVCDDTASVAEVARIMRDRHVGDVLVRSNGRLHGIATDRDIVVRCVAEEGEVGRAAIGDLFTTDPVMVDADASIDDAVERMVDHKVRRLRVVEAGRLVGVVSLGDLAVDSERKSALGDIGAARSNS